MGFGLGIRSALDRCGRLTEEVVRVEERVQCVVGTWIEDIAEIWIVKIIRVWHVICWRSVSGIGPSRISGGIHQLNEVEID